MLVASSFDLWQKDAFFSAAEEVQQSADILESAYRSWLRVKRAGEPTNVVDELHRELKTALGTAKWQLDEFERAVRLTHSTCRDEKRVERHRQFLVAMESQISQVENALNEGLHEEGKQPLQWVNLDEEERDDLAMFLSGTPGNSRSRKDEIVKAAMSCENCAELCSELKGSKDDIAIDIDSSCTGESSVREVPGARDELCCPTDRTVSTRRTCTVPNFGSMQIVIPDEHERWRTMATCIEATPKVKGSRILNSFPVGAISWINQISRCSSIFQRKMQSLRHLHVSRSVQLMIALVLILFLFVSFEWYKLYAVYPGDDRYQHS